MKFWTAKFKIECKCVNDDMCFHAKTAEIKALAFLVHDCGGRILDKVIGKFEEGWAGWDSESGIAEAILVDSLKGHIERENWLDVAAIAMFLMNREDSE